MLKNYLLLLTSFFRSSPSEVFYGKGVPKICRKFIEHPCRSVISIKLQVSLEHLCRAASDFFIVKGDWKVKQRTRLMSQRILRESKYSFLIFHAEAATGGVLCKKVLGLQLY